MPPNKTGCLKSQPPYFPGQSANKITETRSSEGVNDAQQGEHRVAAVQSPHRHTANREAHTLPPCVGAKALSSMCWARSRAQPMRCGVCATPHSHQSMSCQSCRTRCLPPAAPFPHGCRALGTSKIAQQATRRRAPRPLHTTFPWPLAPWWCPSSAHHCSAQQRSRLKRTTVLTTAAHNSASAAAAHRRQRARLQLQP